MMNFGVSVFLCLLTVSVSVLFCCYVFDLHENIVNVVVPCVDLYLGLFIKQKFYHQNPDGGGGGVCLKSDSLDVFCYF